MSFKCKNCNKELELVKWDLNTGHIVCPYCFSILMRNNEMRDMSWFERKLNLWDVKVVEEKIEK